MPTKRAARPSPSRNGRPRDNSQRSVAVAIAHAEFDIQFGSAARCLRHHLFGVGTVVRVHDVAPRIVRRDAAVRLQTIQFPQFLGPDVLVGLKVPFPGAGVRGIESQAETLLALTQGLGGRAR